MSKTTIKIETTSKFHPLRAVWSASTMVAVIGIGVAVDSAAMQWAGFLVLMLTALAVGIVKAAKNDGLTIDQARARLDEIEGGAS